MSNYVKTLILTKGRQYYRYEFPDIENNRINLNQKLINRFGKSDKNRNDIHLFIEEIIKLADSKEKIKFLNFIFKDQCTY